jgi:hypothetical protein
MRTDKNDGKVEWIPRPTVIFTERDSFTAVERILFEEDTACFGYMRTRVKSCVV